MEKKLKMLDANRVLNARITLQTKDESEGQVDFGAYTDYITVNAETKFTKSRLMTQANAENTKKYITFIIRYREDINELMRAIYNSEPWQIESIIPLSNEKLYLQIDCYQIKNDIVGDNYEF